MASAWERLKQYVTGSSPEQEEQLVQAFATSPELEKINEAATPPTPPTQQEETKVAPSPNTTEEILSAPQEAPATTSAPSPAIPEDRSVTDVESANKELDALVAPEAPDLRKEDQELAKSMASYRDDINKAMAVYKKERDTIKQQELWENIINAVGMFAAGMYGLKSGVDASGVKFSKTDWDKKAREAKADLDGSMAQSLRDANLRRSIVNEQKEGKYKNWNVNNQLYRNAMNTVRDRRDAETRAFQSDRQYDLALKRLANEERRLDAQLGEAKGSEAVKIKTAEGLRDKMSKLLQKESSAKGSESKETIRNELKMLNNRYEKVMGRKAIAESLLQPKERAWGFLPDKQASTSELSAALAEQEGQGMAEQEVTAVPENTDVRDYYNTYKNKFGSYEEAYKFLQSKGMIQ